MIYISSSVYRIRSRKVNRGALLGALVIDLPKSQRLDALPIATGVNFRTESARFYTGDDDDQQSAGAICLIGKKENRLPWN